MKVTVLAPSAEYKSYAGARIRYGRIGAKLSEHGIGLTLQHISEFDPQEADCDAVIISKCHDARSLVAAAILSERGRLVGVDLFDDYFSQTGDSRLTRYRSWLSQLLPICDFVLCSTQRMQKVVGRYRPGVPTHIMNDPARDGDLELVGHVSHRKVADARDCGCIRVAWFGVGDNPHFRVGLDDLAAFGGTLRMLGRSGMDVELRVLTNVRALTAERLARITSLPIRTIVEEWTEEAEERLLEQALIAFLPVSAQTFSAAKSLNRAVTAITAGCQILSVGYPLYTRLARLIYRDPAELLHDLEKGSMRVSPDRLSVLREVIDVQASPAREAGGLAEFLRALQPHGVAEGPLVLIHGQATNGVAHKLVQAAGGLSVASPYSTASLGYDVVFREAVDGLTMFVSAKAARQVRPEIQRRLRPAPRVGDRKFLQIADAGGASPEFMMAAPAESALPFQIAVYPESLKEMARLVRDAFGPCRVLVSETSPLPFSMAS